MRISKIIRTEDEIAASMYEEGKTGNEVIEAIDKIREHVDEVQTHYDTVPPARAYRRAD